MHIQEHAALFLCFECLRAFSFGQFRFYSVYHRHEMFHLICAHMISIIQCTYHLSIIRAYDSAHIIYLYIYLFIPSSRYTNIHTELCYRFYCMLFLWVAPMHHGAPARWCALILWDIRFFIATQFRFCESNASETSCSESRFSSAVLPFPRTTAGSRRVPCRRGVSAAGSRARCWCRARETCDRTRGSPHIPQIFRGEFPCIFPCLMP